jgi:hypothetical protein
LGHECVRNDDEDPDSETVDTCRISLGDDSIVSYQFQIDDLFG